jgi:hypothetical protein
VEVDNALVERESAEAEAQVKSDQKSRAKADAETARLQRNLEHYRLPQTHPDWEGWSVSRLRNIFKDLLNEPSVPRGTSQELVVHAIKEAILYQPSSPIVQAPSAPSASTATAATSASLPAVEPWDDIGTDFNTWDQLPARTSGYSSQSEGGFYEATANTEMGVSGSASGESDKGLLGVFTDVGWVHRPRRPNDWT